MTKPKPSGKARKRPKMNNSIGIASTPPVAKDTQLHDNQPLVKFSPEKGGAQSNQMLQSILDTTPMLVAFMDPKYNFIQVNRAYARSDGKKPEFFPGKNHFKLFPDKENAKIFSQVVKSGKPFYSYAKAFEYKKNPERGISYWDWSLIPMKEKGKVIGLVLTLADVSDRIRTQFSLSESEKRYRELYEKTPAMLHSIDTQGRITQVSDYWLEIMGYQKKEVLGKLVSSFLIKEDKQYWKKEIIPEFFKKGQVRNIPFHFVKKNGEIIDTLLSASSEKDPKGGIVRSLSIINNITELKRIEKALKQSETSLRAILNATNESVLLIGRNGTVITLNNMAAKRIGKSWVDIIQKNINELFPPGVSKARLAKINSVFKNGKPLIFQDFRDPLFFENHIYPIFDENNKVVQAAIYARDITKEKLFEMEQRRSQEALALSEEKYRNVSTLVQSGIWQLDRQLKTLFVNPAMARMLGYSEEEMLGKSIFDFCNPEKLEIYKANLQRRKQGVTESTEVEYIHKNGKKIIAQINASPIIDAKGTFQGAIAGLMDITERKENEDELRKFLLAADTSMDPILISDTNGIITYNNGAAEKFFGYERGELLAIPIGNLTSDPDFQRQVIFPAIQEKGGWTGEVFSLKKDGSLLPALITTSLIKDEKGKAVGMMGILRDIADRKKQEETLQLAKQEAEQASRSKSQFLANMSHDIRTPMNAILGMTRLLLNTSLSGTQQEYLNTVMDSANSLLGLLNDILDFSKIEAGQIVFAMIDFDLRDLIEETILGLAFPAHEKGLEIFYQYDEANENKLRGDPLRLKQVLQNLLSNAIKFTSQGHVYLKVKEEILADSGILLHFSVEDTGVGIKVEDRQKIFNSFTQLHDNSLHALTGTGLGLAISKKLTELMGGQISVKSEKDRGSTFHFTAIFEISKDQKIKEFAKVHFAEPKSILLISDHAGACKALRAMLQFREISIEEKRTGGNFLEDIRQAQDKGRRFDLVIIDLKTAMVQQPDNLKKIYAEESGPALPVILLFSAFENTLKEFCDNHRNLYYLTKPILCRNLNLVVKNALEKKEQPLYNPTLNPLTREENKSWPTLEILVVEDNKYNRDLAMHILTNAGHRITLAQNGREALEILSRKIPSLILMDIQMPEMDGIAATRNIRLIEKGERLEFMDAETMQKLSSNLKGKHLPIMAMTAFAMAEDKNKSIEAGMDDYITKPFNPEEILDKIQSLYQNFGQWSAQMQSAMDSEKISSAAPLELVSVKKFLKENFHFPSEKIEIMLNNLKGSLIEVLLRLEKSLSEKNYNSLANDFHNLKGVFYNIGSNHWAKEIHKAETKLRNGDYADFGDLVKKLRIVVSQIIQ